MGSWTSQQSEIALVNTKSCPFSGYSMKIKILSDPEYYIPLLIFVTFLMLCVVQCNFYLATASAKQKLPVFFYTSVLWVWKLIQHEVIISVLQISSLFFWQNIQWESTQDTGDSAIFFFHRLNQSAIKKYLAKPMSAQEMHKPSILLCLHMDQGCCTQDLGAPEPCPECNRNWKQNQKLGVL